MSLWGNWNSQDFAGVNVKCYSHLADVEYHVRYLPAFIYLLLWSNFKSFAHLFMWLFVLLSWKIFVLHGLDRNSLKHVLQGFSVCFLPFNFANGVFQIKFLFCWWFVLFFVLNTSIFKNEMTLMFSKSFIIWELILRFVIHFELILCKGELIFFLFFSCGYLIDPAPFVEKSYFPVELL